ncbi:MAG: hypothetical protein IIZ78_22420 [Clostridiales bacterium]|nr:hypothetical protein [Clostridiales bacterium]
MDTKNITMAIVSLAIAVVLVAGLMVPVISSLGSGGGSGAHENPDTVFKMNYATAPTDFEIEFGLDRTTQSVYIESNGRMEYIMDSGSSPPPEIVSQTMAPVFYSEDIYIGMTEGYFTLVWEGELASIKTAGFTGTLTCENGIATVSTSGGPIDGPYSFELPEWYYYADAEGDFGAYTLSQINEGVYVDTDYPICPLTLSEYPDIVMLYRDHYTDILDGTTPHEVTSYQTISDDGLVESMGWTVDSVDCPAYVLIAPFTVGSEGSGGSGISDTLLTLISVIPLITVIGIVIGAVGYLRMKN